MDYDILIKNGRVFDGTGSPWFRGDSAIVGERKYRGEDRLYRGR